MHWVAPFDSIFPKTLAFKMHFHL